MSHPREDRSHDFQPSRAPDGRYRTTPLEGLWTHLRRGFSHDDRFPTLDALLDHHDAQLLLGLPQPRGSG